MKVKAILDDSNFKRKNAKIDLLCYLKIKQKYLKVCAIRLTVVSSYDQKRLIILWMQSEI